MVVNLCGGEYVAHRVFYKSRNAKDMKAAVMWYINTRKTWETTIEMDYNKKTMESWILETFYEAEENYCETIT